MILGFLQTKIPNIKHLHEIKEFLHLLKHS